MAALNSIFLTILEAFWRAVDGVIGSDREDVLAIRAARAETIVRIYYAFLMVWSYGRIGAAANSFHRPVLPSLDLALTSWIPLDSWRQAAGGLALLMLGASIVAAMVPRWRIPRILAIGSLLLLDAMKFDLQSKISHSSLLLVWAGIALCFLPSGRNDSNESRRNYLASFFGAQVLVCLLFTCSGISKIIGIAYDWSSGVTWLDPEALPLILAADWTARRFSAGPFFVLNPWASWLSNVGVLYLETAAVFAVFRPRLHRPWALGLLIMHAMVWLAMVIQFGSSAFAVSLILLASPFAPEKLDLKQTLLDLPGVRFVHQTLLRARGGESSRGTPWVPTSTVMRLWIPVLVVVYLGVAFGTFDTSGGLEHASPEARAIARAEIYPFSALPMFMRIDSSKKNLKKLARVRKKLERRRNRIRDGRVKAPPPEGSDRF